MKKVLIIANLFHASPRIPGLASYLPEIDWEATIVTPPLGINFQNKYSPPKKFFANTKIIEVPYRGDIFWFWRKLAGFLGFKKNTSITEQIKEKVGVVSKKSFIDKLLNFYQAVFGYPDTEKYWIKPTMKAVEELLRREKFDAILSSSPYQSSHLIAAKIKNEFLIPWIADMRDLWTQNHNYQYPKLRKFFETKLEIRTLSQANALTTISVPLVEHLQSRYKNKNIRSIPNGFDPEIVNEPPTLLTKKFTITYTGRIYTQKQDPMKLIRALKELIEGGNIDSNEIEVNFFGEKLIWLDNEIEKFGLKNIVHQYNQIPREEIIKKQRESQVLLLLCWEDESEKGVCPKKTFEYLAAQRPILATGGSKEEVVKKIIDDLNAGMNATTTNEIKTVLMNLYKEYKEKGFVAYRGNKEKINEYDYRAMAKKFAEALNKIILN